MIRYEHLPDYIVLLLADIKNYNTALTCFNYSNKNLQTSKFNVIGSFIPGLGRAYKGTEVQR